MRLNKINHEFQWIGVGVPFQRRGNKIRYEAFNIGSLKVNVGNFVLVRNDDALDPEDVMTCYVAQVKDLFDNGDETDSHQAQLQWFSRIPELPQYAIKSLKSVPHTFEVVKEQRSTWSDVIDAETIFQICDVIFLTLDADCESLLSKYNDHPFPVYFCRYRFTGNSLIPVIKENDAQSLKTSNSFTSVTPLNGATDDFIPCTEKKKKDMSKKTPFHEKMEGIYRATVIGSPEFPKVLIKRIDDRILDNKNGNVRVFVADSSAQSIDDVTEKLREKLNLEKHESENNVKNRPIIHTFKPVPQNTISPPQSLECNEMIEHDSFAEPDVLPRNTEKPKTRKNSAFPKDVHPQGVKSVKEKSSVIVRSSPRKKVAVESNIQCTTPQKKAKVSADPDGISLTRSGRKVKAINYSENEKNMEWKTGKITPKKKIPHFVLPSCSEDSDSTNFSATEEDESDSSLDEMCKPLNKHSKVQRKSKKLSKKSSKGSSLGLSSVKKNANNLVIPERKTPLKTPQNVLEESRQRLHVSAVPSSLPCREEEFSDIYSFVKGCLCAQTGGCMYISGVPGTGKTATVHEVMRNLEEEKESGEVPIFTFIEVNGMWMTDPYQCYVQIFKTLMGKSIAPQQAADLLEKRFTEPGPKNDAVVLLVDELDRLWTRKQTVMYNIFDWPSKKNSKLVVLAIANTMDLPERMMMNRISSRLGLTRKTFQPYTFRQLQEIIMSRIQELKVFDPDAVQLVSRKVAAVSGDARRALDICRFATEVVKIGQTPKKSKKVLVGMEHVDIALQQMFSSPLISAIRSSSRIAKFFFQCMLSEFTRTGIEETTLLKVYRQVVSSCRFEGVHPPNSSEISKICADLAASHLILVDNFSNDLHMKIRLNVSSDDVTYALTLK